MSMQDLARAVGEAEGGGRPLSYQTVQQWESGKSAPKRSRLEVVARVLGSTAQELLGLPAVTETQQPPGKGVAVRIHAIQNLQVPKMVPWEGLMRDLPERFSVRVTDSALSPRVDIGDIVMLDRTQQPKPGDGVLVRDARGDHYLRLYRQASATEWSAGATSQAYSDLSASVHGLEVVAVVVGDYRDRRWT